MPNLEITKPELVWPGKYDANGQRVVNRGAALPFQAVETICEGRATRQSGSLGDLFSHAQRLNDTENWHNKLIWGDNLLVMASLLKDFAGKVDLIYIDPPFATGADFTFRAEIGDEELLKEPSAIEEKAYRDTWGQGLTSYLAMLDERMPLLRDLLSQRGSIFLHIDYNVGFHVKLLMDNAFGDASFVNAITWKRSDAHSDVGQGALHLGRVTDLILYYVRTPGEQTLNMEFSPLPTTTVEKWYRHVEEGTGRRYNKADITGPGGAVKGNPVYEWKGITRAWRFSKTRMEELDKEGRVVYSASGMPYLKRYLDESRGVPLQDLWDDIKMLRGIHTHSEFMGYKTQKPEELLSRIIRMASNPGDLVADFFCGSGTTAAAAEKLGRRWIACDMGRYAIHTTRKRLLGISDCKPFQILNLGSYERQYWAGSEFSEADTQRMLGAYIGFILALYQAQPAPGTHIHGRKAGALVHVGAVDAPVTIAEVNEALAECATLKRDELHVLGWEWEMGMNDPIIKHAKAQYGIRLRLLAIPREVMEKRAVECGDIRFFDLAYLDAAVVAEDKKGRTAHVELKDFVIPDTDLIPADVRAKITKWSDYIDYWAVDWAFQNDTFMNQWQAYRTRKERKLELASAAHTYDKPGKVRILIKVVDIFGNDTSRLLEHTVK